VGVDADPLFLSSSVPFPSPAVENLYFTRMNISGIAKQTQNNKLTNLSININMCLQTGHQIF